MQPNLLIRKAGALDTAAESHQWYFVLGTILGEGALLWPATRRTIEGSSVQYYALDMTEQTFNKKLPWAFVIDLDYWVAAAWVPVPPIQLFSKRGITEDLPSEFTCALCCYLVTMHSSTPTMLQNLV